MSELQKELENLAERMQKAVAEGRIQIHVNPLNPPAVEKELAEAQRAASAKSKPSQLN